MQAAYAPKLLSILSVLDVAQTPNDLAIPSFKDPPAPGWSGGSLVDLGHRQLAGDVPVRRRLEAAGVGTARAWLAMQSAYDLAAERASGSPTVRRLVEVA